MTLLSNVKFKWKTFSNFVAFLEYLNFNEIPNFVSGCGVTKELFLEQAKKKVTKLEEDLSKSKKKSDLEISHYKDTALKWKNRTLYIQQKIQPCLQCKVYVQDYSKK